MDANPPEEGEQFSCEQCGIIIDVENGITNEDENGNLFSLCPECGGEYDKVYVEQEGDEWVVKKANFHEIDRYRRRTKAKKKANDIAFIVETVYEYE